MRRVNRFDGFNFVLLSCLSAHFSLKPSNMLNTRNLKTSTVRINELKRNVSLISAMKTA